MTEAREQLERMREAAAYIVLHVQELPPDHLVDITDLETVNDLIDDLVELNKIIRPDVDGD